MPADPYDTTPAAQAALAVSRTPALSLERDLTEVLTLAYHLTTELWNHNTTIEAYTLADTHDKVASVLRNLGAKGPWNDDHEEAE
jgi:hypothetical protein